MPIGVHIVLVCAKVHHSVLGFQCNVNMKSDILAVEQLSSYVSFKITGRDFFARAFFRCENVRRSFV